MPRSQITVTDTVRSGATAPAQTSSDASNGHYFTGLTGMEWIEIVNTAASGATVTVRVNPSYFADGLVVNNLSIIVGAGATVVAAPFKVLTFKQNSTNDVYIDPGVSTTLKLRVWRLAS